MINNFHKNNLEVVTTKSLRAYDNNLSVDLHFLPNLLNLILVI